MDINVLEFVENLKKKGYKAEYVKTANEALEYLLKNIPSKASVGIGGSMTIEETGAYDALINRGNEVYWHWKVPREKMFETREKANKADAYLCSSNAASIDGTFYNTDGAGNRVAAISYGKNPLFIVMSENKIMLDEKTAIDRIKEIACPLNAKRLNLNTPCAITGKCNNCSSPSRMCNVTCILQRPTGGREVHVIVVKEKLGF